MRQLKFPSYEYIKSLPKEDSKGFANQYSWMLFNAPTTVYGRLSYDEGKHLGKKSLRDVIYMVETKNIKTKDNNIDKIIEEAVANIELEGGKIDNDIKAKAKEILQGKITYKEYLEYIKQKHNLPPYDRL